MRELFRLLTEKQGKVGWYTKKGLTAKEIGELLGISPNTVKDHRKAACEKLDVSNSKELAGLSGWTDYMKNISDLSMPTISSTIYDLNGIWLSKFIFDMYRQESFIPGEQFNIEKIESQSKQNTYAGRNLRCRSSIKIDYLHNFEFEVFGNFVLGKWFNKNTSNCGCYQLYIHNNGNMMFGKHLGNASNNNIMPGDWIWIRVDVQWTDYEKEDFLEEKQLISFTKLDENFEKFIEDGFTIDLNCLIE